MNTGQNCRGGSLLRAFLPLIFILICASLAFAQQPSDRATAPETPETAGQQTPDKRGLPDKPQPAQSESADTAGASGVSSAKAEDQAEKTSGPQPSRILGVMPNFRAVSAGTLPPPPTPKQALWIATQNSFDYSAFIFVAITSAMSEGSNSHPQLGKGVAGFGRYYWRGFLDKTDGNYLVIFAFPSILHEDERYYAKGRGGFWKRFAYSSTRIFITPNYQGHNTVNFSELFGRGISQAISATYYPSEVRTVGAISTKLGYAFLRDAATNVFREFWPDISTHVLHRHP
jgi:hypothetical protein